MKSNILYLKRLRLYSQKESIHLLLKRLPDQNPIKKHSSGFYLDLLDQSIIVWHNSRQQPKAFLSFTQDSSIPEFSFIPAHHFITSIVIDTNYEDMGIEKELIDYMLLHTPMKEFYHFVTASTLSSEEAMIELLDNAGFSVVSQQMVNRELGINKKFYSRKIPSPVILKR